MLPKNDQVVFQVALLAQESYTTGDSQTLHRPRPEASRLVRNCTAACSGPTQLSITYTPLLARYYFAWLIQQDDTRDDGVPARATTTFIGN